MKADFGECESPVKSPRIVLSERKCSITFLNPSRQAVRKIHIDGCVITRGERCDYLLVTTDSTEHYVELKGRDVGHAIEQIRATIRELSLDASRQKKHSYVVCTRCPMAGPDIQKHRLRFKHEFKSTLDVKRLKHEVAL